MMKQMKDWKLKSNMGENISFFYSVMRRKQTYFENWKMRTSYSKMLSKDDSHFTRRLHTKQLIYNEFPFELHTSERQIKKAQLNLFEVEHLYRTLYAEAIRSETLEVRTASVRRVRYTELPVTKMCPVYLGYKS
jgi:hypothetical protein